MTLIRKRQLRLVDERFRALRNKLVHQAKQPEDGWIRTVREALGMTEEQLAKRLSLSKQGVHQLERRERDYKVTLETLRSVAEALDADLIYAIVPRKPIQTTLGERAREVAAQRVARISKTMQLEDQAVGEREEEALIQDYARQLLEKPRELWR